MSTSSERIRTIVSETIDLHVHVGPDILPREFTVESLAREDAGSLAGFCPKTHSFPPVFEPELAAETDLDIVGSITLNHYVGGLNPDAIYAASVIYDGPFTVWFPTMHAQNHLESVDTDYEIPASWVGDEEFQSRAKASIDGIRVTDEDGALTEACLDVLDAMAAADCILATGHLSVAESEALALEAIDRGIPCIVTHVMSSSIQFPIERQRALAEAGVFMEHCFEVAALAEDDDHYEERVRTLQEVGPEYCILSTDVGQVNNPSSSDGLAAFVETLLEHGIAEEDVRRMCVDNPRAILADAG